MPVDEALLESHASFEDARMGVSEAFVRLDAGPQRTWGVLTRPLGDVRAIGWVMCHSYGNEQVELHMTDLAMARALASQGYPTLRFHCQGYGDSDDVDTPPRPSTQVRDIVDATRQFRDLTGVEKIGLVGSRVGGAIAAMAAPRVQASHLVLVQPVVNGSKFVTELFRSRVITEMFLDNRPTEVSTVESLRTALQTEGMVNVKGWRLDREAGEELRAVNLVDQVSGFSGRALIVQVSRSAELQGSLRRLAGALQRSGADARLEVLVHAAAPNFGHEHFRPVEKGLLGDVLEGVNQGVIELTMAWLQGRLVSSGQAPQPPRTGEPGERQ